MKIHYAAVLAHFIDDLSNQILMAINQCESTLYARAGRSKTRQELGQEGAKIRNAMKDLRKIVSDINMAPMESVHRQLSLFSINDSEAPTGSVSSDMAAKHIFDLFDFEYYEYTSSAILSKIESYVLEEMKDLEKNLQKLKKVKRLTPEQTSERIENADKIKACKEILEVLHEIEDMETPEGRWSELMRIQDSEEQPLNVLIDKIVIQDISSQIDKVMKDVRDRAPEIIAQHLDIVMNYAFSGLRNLPNSKWDAICERFLFLVGKTFNWEQLPIVMSRAGDLRPKHSDYSKEEEIGQEAITDAARKSGSPGNYF